MGGILVILYFSGTGNSRYVAQIIQEATGDPLISINDCIRRGHVPIVQSDEPLVFAAPTYAWRIPRVVEQFINDATFEGNKKAYFVMTCGDDIGNAEHYLKKLCVKNGLQFSGVAEIIMPENYVAMFDVPARPEAERIINAAKPAIQAAARQISSGEWLKPSRIKMLDQLKSRMVNRFFYPFVVHANKFYATPNCIGCGKCAQLCPLNNVRLEQGRPQWGKNCTHCMACICICPVTAIEYGKASQGKPRYYLESDGRFKG